MYDISTFDSRSQTLLSTAGTTTNAVTATSPLYHSHSLILLTYSLPQPTPPPYLAPPPLPVEFLSCLHSHFIIINHLPSPFTGTASTAAATATSSASTSATASAAAGANNAACAAAHSLSCINFALHLYTTATAAATAEAGMRC